MLKEINIPRVCNLCQGTGIWNKSASTDQPETIVDPCPRCLGTGYQEFYKLILPNRYFWTTDVLNCIVPAELAALSADNRTKVMAIISMSICNLNVGTLERSWLLDTFGAGSGTRTNLQRLV
jgi:hypothetical protein